MKTMLANCPWIHIKTIGLGIENYFADMRMPTNKKFGIMGFDHVFHSFCVVRWLPANMSHQDSYAILFKILPFWIMILIL